MSHLLSDHPEMAVPLGDTPRTVELRITDYLSSGGLFNPELANHDAVRDLLIDARDALTAERERADRLMRLAYLAGWNASGEGYNAEYPFGNSDMDPEADAKWIAERDTALDAARRK